MPLRNLLPFAGGVSVVMMSACSFSDAGESTRATETNQAPSSSVVTADDIPGDVFEDSWARLPLLRREALDAAGQRAGLEAEIIDLVKRRGDLDAAGEVPGLGEQERTIIAFVREVVTEEKVTSATFDRALELFGEQGVMDLAGLVGYYGFVNMTLKTFDVQLAPGRERLLPDLW